MLIREERANTLCSFVAPYFDLTVLFKSVFSAAIGSIDAASVRLLHGRRGGEARDLPGRDPDGSMRSTDMAM